VPEAKTIVLVILRKILILFFANVFQERERRRQHMVLMRQLDGKKRNDERDKKREELRLEKERDRERKLEQKRLENEIINEMRKPIEDMTLSDQKELPEIKRIPEMILSGEAFANILMVHEFLHNFGHRLGFDMESLPTLSELQAALLNDPEAEEELLSVVIHLLVCAIDDPGIPTPHKHLTLLGQNLRQADITNTNVSEILKIYLTARGQVEVKNIHGVVPPETHSAKDRTREIPFCQEKMDQFNRLLEKTRAYEMAQWVKDKPFLCLNPTEMSEILAFICNELLFNKSVLHQIETNVEKVNKSKKVKLIVETKLKRLKSTHARRFKTLPSKPEEADNATNGTIDESTSEVASTVGDQEKDDSMSVVSESTNDATTSSASPKKGKRGRKPKSKGKPGSKKGKAAAAAAKNDVEDEAEENDDLDETDLADLEKENEDEETLTQEELQKKIEKTAKQFLKSMEDLAHTNNCLRVTDLGQDRYRRRYWHFAHAGGLFVEGMESCEPWKLEHKGMPHCSKAAYEKANMSDEDEEEESEISDTEPEEPVEKKPKLENKENIENDEKKDSDETQEALRKLSSEILVTPKAEAKPDEKSLISPKTTPNGDKLNMFNHSAIFNMSLSPVLLNGSVTISPKLEPPVFNTSSPAPGPIPNPSDQKGWFSVVPGHKNVDHFAKFEEFSEDMKVQQKPKFASNPQIALLQLKLEQMKKLNVCKERKEIPDEMGRGWWHSSDPSTVGALEKALNIRGAREQMMLHNTRKHFDYVLMENGSKRPLGPDIVLDELEDVEDLVILPCGVPAPDKPGKWSKEVALRVDKYILEQVEALEDKVASASMQVPGWKLPNRPDIETRKFQPSCDFLAAEEKGEKLDTKAGDDPVAEARERLLELEGAIERRYLKAPLGHSNAEVSLQTITSSSVKSSSSSSNNTPTSRRTTNISLNISKELKNSDDSQMENGEDDESPDTSRDDDENGDENGDEQQKSNLPRGLLVWREGVKKAKTAAQLATAFYVLETSIAWHKSIMKAFCQLCHSGDDEDSLLLCDGCDKGYHMYCFKPAITKVPEGDWYCFECINKATGVRHCLVCGKQDGKHLIPCTSCPRAYHTDCLSPSLSKVIISLLKNIFLRKR
jgi:hypothetical protein